MPEPGLQRREFGGGQHQGNRIAAPVDRTFPWQDRGYPFLGERLLQQPRALRQCLVAEPEHGGQQRAPMRFGVPCPIRHFIERIVTPHDAPPGVVPRRSGRLGL